MAAHPKHSQLRSHDVDADDGGTGHTVMPRFVKCDEGGQSLVEFALILPVLLLIITGVFDVGRAAWQENTLAYAAREGTRYAIVHGSAAADTGTIAYPNPLQPGANGTISCTSTPSSAGPPSCSGIFGTVRNAAVGVSSITVTATWPPTGCIDRNCQVQVDASSPFVPLPSRYLLGGIFQITLRGGSKLVIQR
jgi:Flp pilus assembly protein TadG